MKIRILSIACVTTAAALLTACTAVYKNSDACEQLMRSKLAESSADTLKLAHRGAGIYGSRVVIEGSIEHVVAVSEAAPASAASATTAAGAPRTASGAAATPGASGAEALSLKPSKPKKIVTRAAAECTFHGSTLDAFNWLAPAKFVARVNDPASEATE